jgi:hypothetical protein
LIYGPHPEEPRVARRLEGVVREELSKPLGGSRFLERREV